MNILLEAIRSMDSWEAGWWGGGGTFYDGLFGEAPIGFDRLC